MAALPVNAVPKPVFIASTVSLLSATVLEAALVTPKIPTLAYIDARLCEIYLPHGQLILLLGFPRRPIVASSPTITVLEVASYITVPFYSALLRPAESARKRVYVVKLAVAGSSSKA